VALCAQPFAGQGGGAESGAGSTWPGTGTDFALPYDPFHYRRRGSLPIQLGGAVAGGNAAIAVAGQVPAQDVQVLPMLGTRGLKAQRPELLIWDLNDRADLARLEELAWKDEGPAPRALVAASSRIDLLLEALGQVQAVRLICDDQVDRAALADLARRSAALGVALWLQADLGQQLDEPVARVAALAADCVAAGQPNVIAGVRAKQAAAVVRGTRQLAARLAAADLHCPIALQTPTQGEPMLAGAAALGSLLCDGIGDLVQAGSVPLAFDLLQGAGARLTRTDYVACPSCGRTLFDLQSTTDRIKSSTSHLQGVKIAVMGCVVNGPGEMADADFGYMGGSPGSVNLYVRRDCVKRSVPEADAPAVEVRAGTALELANGTRRVLRSRKVDPQLVARREALRVRQQHADALERTEA